MSTQTRTTQRLMTAALGTIAIASLIGASVRPEPTPARPVAPDFTGVIEFEYESCEVTQTSQSGRMWIGADGATRLDLWHSPNREPIVCGVSGSTAWMVWGASPTLYVGNIAAQPRNFESWHSPLFLQAKQTRDWREHLLNGALPHETEWAKFGPWNFPFSIRSVTRDQPIQPAVSHWRVTRVEAHAADDPGFRAELMCPQPQSGRFPSILCESRFNTDGTEVVTPW